MSRSEIEHFTEGMGHYHLDINGTYRINHLSEKAHLFIHLILSA